MQVHHGVENLPKLKNAVITIGTFDGVHSGHAQIIAQLKKEAEKIDGETVIITFHPHPRMIVQSPTAKKSGVSDDKIYLLNTLAEKIELIAQKEIDHLVIIPFTTEFSEQTAEDYIKEFLVKNFQPKIIIIGYDHHFGKGRKGNYKLLEQYADEFNYIVNEIPEHVLNDIIISSTKVRNALLTGDTETANKFLGYEYSFEGEIVHGDKIGRTIGYPTANITIIDEHKLIPGDGVYVVEIKIDQNIFQGMMSIGIRPTIGGTKRMIEVNIFDFQDDIYGRKIRVFLKKYLRAELKFNSLEELKDQIDFDKNESLKFFAKSS